MLSFPVQKTVTISFSLSSLNVFTLVPFLLAVCPRFYRPVPLWAANQRVTSFDVITFPPIGKLEKKRAASGCQVHVSWSSTTEFNAIICKIIFDVIIKFQIKEIWIILTILNYENDSKNYETYSTAVDIYARGIGISCKRLRASDLKERRRELPGITSHIESKRREKSKKERKKERSRWGTVGFRGSTTALGSTLSFTTAEWRCSTIRLLLSQCPPLQFE